MNKSAPLIICDPASAIIFSVESAELTSTLFIKNVSNGIVAIKVKSNAPKNYKVSPSKGTLNKGQSLQLLIKAKQVAEASNHSFMILAQSIDSLSVNLQKI